LLQQPRVTAALLRKTAQLDLNYRGTSLAREATQPAWGVRTWFASRRTPHAGDRAPDARVRAVRTGSHLRLFDAFRGPHWTLLVFTGRTQNVEKDDRLATIAQRITTAYGEVVQPYLIRSSVHLGAIRDNGDFPVLVDDMREAHALYGAALATLVLVRPDGYIGLRSELTTQHDLFTYLHDVFGVLRDRSVHLEPVQA
jgi:hypothetical protein